MGSSATTASMLEHALLALVHQRPSSGYDLRKLFAESHLHHFSSSPGAIYPALQRLEKKGLIFGTTEQGDTLRPRRVYEITDEGTKILHAWLARPVARDDVVSNIKELTLRFAFMGDLLDDDATLQFLNGLIAQLVPFLDELEEFVRSGTGDLSLHGRLAVESGVAHYQSFLGWARKARQRFQPR
ncbi:PadR family transcriptional regulator [Gemmatimonadota bacterium]